MLVGLKTYKPQGGYVLVMLAIVVAAMMVGFMHTLDSVTLRVAQTERTIKALHEAKEALIAHAVTGSPPGKLVCPEDTSSVGTTSEGGARGSCSNNVMQIGRLAWRSLNLPQVPDSTGEQLWYALSPGFQSGSINSNTPGQLSLNGIPVAAIIFSPGIPTSDQSRPTISKAAPPSVGNYLDGTNKDGDNTFVTTGTNDMAVGITVAELMAPVSKRVLAEIAGPNVSVGEPPISGIRAYYAQTGSMPLSLNDLKQETLRDPPRTYLGTSDTWLTNNGWLSLVGYAPPQHTALGSSPNATLSSGSHTMVVPPCTVQPCP